MKYYLIAGEASGDIHGANLIKALAETDPQAVFRFWGGNRMHSACDTPPVKHYKDLAFMGFAEVIANLRTITRNLDFCKSDIKSYDPNVLILIDYPGFNLRIAEFANKSGIKVAYYISPQIWAWKESRIKKIKAFVDLMMVILPFEADFYKKHQYKAYFVGHPLLDHISVDTNHKLTNTKRLAILPGSRKQEVERMLPVMLEAAKLSGFQKVMIAATSHLPADLYQKHLSDSNVEIIYDQMHGVLQQSDLALVTSGTATLETALFGVPQIVCYKASPLSYSIARRLIKVKFISLVNLIMNQAIVKEMIQDEMNAQSLAAELKNLNENKDARDRILKNYQLLRQKLGGQGASVNAAKLINSLINNKLNADD